MVRCGPPAAKSKAHRTGSCVPRVPRPVLYNSDRSELVTTGYEEDNKKKWGFGLKISAGLDPRL